MRQRSVNRADDESRTLAKSVGEVASPLLAGFSFTNIIGSSAAGTPPATRGSGPHMLGYGHFLTKSRRYSVTFGQLRAARTRYRRAERHPGGERDPWGRP